MKDISSIEDNERYFDWRSSEPPNTLGRFVATRSGIGKGQWHQVAFTWVGNELSIYVNGKQYQTRNLPLKAAKTNEKIQGLGIAMNGLDHCPAEKKYDQIEAELDFPRARQGQRTAETGQAETVRTDRSHGKKTAGNWTFGPDSNSHLFSGIARPGKYTLTALLDKGSKVTCAIDRPDLSFIGNGFGNEEGW